MGSIVKLTTLEDLKKLLSLQKTITSQAKNELLAAINNLHVDQVKTIDQVKAFMEEEKKILVKYAKYPTLTEYQLVPSNYSGSKWGATFGVTLLVGELIFTQLKEAHPHFGHVTKSLFIILMNELEHPQHEYLIEALEKSLKVKVTTEGSELTAKKSKEYVRGIINDFVDTTVALCEAYDIIKVKKGGVVITPLGKRILLHLMDANKFVEEMTEAHTKFQTTKPKLSMH